jgi:hypothetical protein
MPMFWMFVRTGLVCLLTLVSTEVQAQFAVARSSAPLAVAYAGGRESLRSSAAGSRPGGDPIASANGSISGTITDQTNAAIPGAMVTVTNRTLGSTLTVTSDQRGRYAFPSLPVGTHDFTCELSGFRTQKWAAITVDADEKLRIDIKLEIGIQGETVEVSGSASDVRVERLSTQLGEVVTGDNMTTLSLNGRSYTDLLPIQPGITPVTTMKPNSIIMAGVTGAIEPSGALNPGNVSINGQRERANGFYVNGGSVQEHMNGGTSIVPNLDSIAEFRVLTNKFDAEYGNYNGAIVTVVTKSGADRLHGDAFDFVRATPLAIGSNAASVWWVSGQQAISLYNDRQAVIDDGVSRRLTLKKGANVVRAAIINAGGATDFCARFLDADDRPVKNFTVTLTAR